MDTQTAPAAAKARSYSALFAPGASVEMNDEQLRCAETLRAVAAPYNLVVPGGSISDAVAWRPDGLSVVIAGELSTYDNDRLTALVIAAHANRVRVAISAWDPTCDTGRAETIRRRCAEQVADHCDVENYDADDIELVGLEITLHARSATGGLFDGHPGLDELAATIG